MDCSAIRYTRYPTILYNALQCITLDNTCKAWKREADRAGRVGVGGSGGAGADVALPPAAVHQAPRAVHFHRAPGKLGSLHRTLTATRTVKEM